MSRVLQSSSPFMKFDGFWGGRSNWPASWISAPGIGLQSCVVSYRRKFSLPEPKKIRVHVSADQFYELYVDGQSLGRGPERGDLNNWNFETYELDLAAGDHVIVSRVSWINPDDHQVPAAFAQQTISPAFLLAAEGQPQDLLNTGRAPWECCHLKAYTFTSPRMTRTTPSKTRLDGTKMQWDYARGLAENWEPAANGHGAQGAHMANEIGALRLLRPATLPAMVDAPDQVGVARHVESVQTVMGEDQLNHHPVHAAAHLPAEAATWDQLLAGKGRVIIPPMCQRRVIIDLQNYYTAFTDLTVSGGKGATVRVSWAESLLIDAPNNPFAVGPKEDRSAIEGRFFHGVGDELVTDGGMNRRFVPMWWQAGRYVEVWVATGLHALTIESLLWRRTHYPYDFTAKFEASDSRLSDITRIGIRAMESCSHETYMDCPYYEQMMYVGDTRLEVLTTYALTKDDRLPRKAISMFNASRLNSGFTQSRYPSRIHQIIPPFSLYWSSMVYDQMMWRNDRDFVLKQLPGVRGVLDAFRGFLNADGLLEGVDGWNFVDWSDWPDGMPPGAAFGVSGILNWHFAYTLVHAAKMEEFAGNAHLAAHHLHTASHLVQAIHKAFFNSDRGLYADDLEHTRFSEHAQCFALLSGLMDKSLADRVSQNLFGKNGQMSLATIYFSHYLFEVCKLTGRIDKLFDRLAVWFGHKALNLFTTVEAPEPTRSDCHAWGAHPIYHWYATILGIRPASTGFGSVEIMPQLGPLEWARGTMPTPQGDVSVDVRRKGNGLTGEVILPASLHGSLLVNGKRQNISGGKTTIA